MAVASADAIAMVDHDRLAIAAHGFCQGDNAIGRGDDSCAVVAADIHSAMERAFSVERIDALTEASGDLSLDRPEIGSGVSLDPVGRGGVPSQPHRQTDHGRTAQSRAAQRVQLIERGAYVRIMDLFGSGG